MTIELIYNNESLELEAITSSFQLREIFSNNLKQADNSLKFSAVFTIELANFLKTHIDRDVLCVVTENNSRLFTGYVRKNVSFQKTQINQPIALEIVSPSFILNKTVDGGLAFIEKTLAYIVTTVLSKAGVTSVGSLTALGYIPQCITLNDGENFKTFLTDLLFEYGYVWDFDANGVFQVYPLFNVPDVSDITQTFNGQNCLGQIQITAKDHEADSVKATYSKIEHYDDALIFSDTTNANGSYQCQQKVATKSYFGNKEFNYLDCDSTKGEVVYIESLRSDVQADAVQVTWRASKYDLNPDNNNRDLGKQICFSAYNSDNYDHNLSKIDFYGSVFVKAETKVSARSFGEKGTKEITLKYIDSDEKAETFTQNYTEWFRYATNNIVLKSKTDFALGSFVKVTDYGIGTYYGRIVQKVTTLREAFSYTIETLSEFVPAEVSTEQSQGNGVMSAIEGLRENAFAYTDDKITQAQLEGSPRYDVQFNATVIKKLGDGVYSPANITASARKVNGDESEQVYSGVFHIYVNGNSAEYGQPVHGSSLSLNLNDINTYVGEITSLKIVFNSASDAILIDQENIPVLSNPNAYSIVMENDYGAFMCDELGRVSAQTVRCLPHVYYGLEELPFGDTGWDYTIFPVVEGFSFEVDQTTHEIIITTENGAVLPDSGSIGFNLFIHGSADVEERIGYTSEGGDIYIGYISDGMSVELGYISPSEDGVYTCYFSYSKLTELGLLLSEEDDPDSENYGELVLNGRKLKVGSIDADKINVQDLMAQDLVVGNALQSQVYERGVKGFKVEADGEAELNGDVNGTFKSLNFDYDNETGFYLGNTSPHPLAESAGYLSELCIKAIKAWKSKAVGLVNLAHIGESGVISDFMYRTFQNRPVKVSTSTSALISVFDNISKQSVIYPSYRPTWVNCHGYIRYGNTKFEVKSGVHLGYDSSGNVNELQFITYDEDGVIVQANSNYVYNLSRSSIGTFSKSSLDF